MRKIKVITTILILLLVICLSLNIENIKNTISKIFSLQTKKEITYEVYSNQDNILKMLLKVTDNENGIDKIELTNYGTIKCGGQKKVGIDYEIKEDGEYTIKYISTTGEEKQEKIIVNKEFRDNLIEIQSQQEVSYKNDYEVIKDEKYTYYYAIGENSQEWLPVIENKKITANIYEILVNNKQNEDGSITLKLKRINKDGYIVEVAKTIYNLSLLDTFDIDVNDIQATKISVTGNIPNDVVPYIQNYTYVVEKQEVKTSENKTNEGTKCDYINRVSNNYNSVTNISRSSHSPTTK